MVLLFIDFHLFFIINIIEYQEFSDCIVINYLLFAESTGTFGAYFVLWVIFAAINFVYTFTWDVKMDWSLFQKGTKHRFLRKKITYSPKVCCHALTYACIS